MAPGLVYLTLVRVQVVRAEVEPVDVADWATRVRGGFDVAFESSAAAPQRPTGWPPASGWGHDSADAVEAIACRCR